jgi:thiol-disulfide isomerase/thioredoxin
MLNLQSLKMDPINWTFATIDGTEVDLASMRGKVILIDFWATWCAPCLAEMPNVKAVYDKYRDQGFEVIGITLDRSADLAKVKATIENLELDWPHFLDMENRRNRFADELGITSIPAPLLFDKKGLLATDRARGARLESEVRLLLGLEAAE